MGLKIAGIVMMGSKKNCPEAACYMTFLQRVEHGCGLDKPAFGALHPFTSWSFVHAAWVHNRYVVTQGHTRDSTTGGTLISVAVWSLDLRGLVWLHLVLSQLVYQV